MANPYTGVPDDVRNLWPTPRLGDWAHRDVQVPVPVAGGHGFMTQEGNVEQREVEKDKRVDTGIGQPVDPSQSEGTADYTARRGIADRGAYAEQTYNKQVSPLVTRSLARETLYNWADAQWNVGGVSYPFDYGFGPGYHGDATLEQGNVQVYMRPGIFRRPVVPTK